VERQTNLAVDFTDPWAPVSASSSPAFQSDPWSSNSGMGLGHSTNIPKDQEEDEFDALSKRGNNGSLDAKPYNMDSMGLALLAPMNTGGSNTNSQSSNSSPIPAGGGSKTKKNPLEFLGENSGLVNLDNLVPSANLTTTSTSAPVNNLGLMNGLQNPFGSVSSSLLSSTAASQTATNAPMPANPFQVHNVVAKPSINEIREKQQKMQISSVNSVAAAPQNNPWSPVKADNPFTN